MAMTTVSTTHMVSWGSLYMADESYSQLFTRENVCSMCAQKLPDDITPLIYVHLMFRSCKMSHVLRYKSKAKSLHTYCDDNFYNAYLKIDAENIVVSGYQMHTLFPNFRWKGSLKAWTNAASLTEVRSQSKGAFFFLCPVNTSLYLQCFVWSRQQSQRAPLSHVFVCEKDRVIKKTL